MSDLRVMVFKILSLCVKLLEGVVHIHSRPRVVKNIGTCDI